MFSRKPQISHRPPTPPASKAGQARAIALKVANNPWLSAGGAGLLFLLTLVTLIMVMGDAKAGAPMVRLSLAHAAAAGSEVPGWKEALADEGEVPLVTTDEMMLSDTPIELADNGMVGGSAIITLPEGGRLEGADGPLVPVAGAALAQAPLAGLTAPGPGGALLPVIGGDGRKPWQAYARPFTANGKPKVALVIGGLGLNPAYTRRAIELLPPEVTLSFAPYAEGLQSWIDLARAHGHEVLLETPMEPADYPQNDPGPYTLLAGGAPGEIVKKTEWVLSRASGYFGVTNYLGGRFVTSGPAMSSFSGVLKSRGVAFIDDGLAARKGSGPPRASADRIVDEDLSAEAIARQFAALEAGARSNGQAMGSGFAYPVTLESAAVWTRSLEGRGFQLAPASALLSGR
ncbi:MAG: divergent polysaccharide deacetylase family protein [Caulobacteraceae bacterium]|nr:MAG: divergent polysaccharide deacetylase family protein [Caulobacteraceae bacterium]